jgi:membrane protease YdiL (CAAX protease family)
LPEPHSSALTTFATATVFFLFNLLFVATLEEPGWRGFLLDRLQHKFSPLFASLLVWLPWALWHAPLDYYRPGQFSWVNYVLLRVVFLVPLTIILTWFYNRSGRSIQTTVFFHAAMNTFPFVLQFETLSRHFIASNGFGLQNHEKPIPLTETSAPQELPEVEICTTPGVDSALSWGWPKNGKNGKR